MQQFPTTARVVIVGGGAVGASCLYHLAKAGWTDSVLLEKNELTAGSTWHAAGNVPTFSTSWSVMNMQRYSAELYRGLGEAVDYPMNYHVTGSIRLAHGLERMREFHRAAGMGRYQGVDIEIVDVGDIRNLYPFIETHDLAGALYDPFDGDIDPAQLTQALAKGARDLGARIVRFAPATAVSRRNGEWVVSTPKGDVRCEFVVNSAGYYAQQVGEMFREHGGRTVPMATMSHQYMLTDEIPELEKWSRSVNHKLPLLRDVDSSYYLRQEKYGLNLGPYEKNCRAHWVTPDDPLPRDFSFQLFEDDLERLEWYIDDAMDRVPLLGEAGIARVINGPIPYAPDGLPLIGPMPGVRNAFEACVFTFGIAQAGGAGKVLAEWVTEGETEWDMWSCDPRRYTDYTSHAYCVAKAKEIYGNEYAIQFPYREWPDGRPSKLSPVHDRVVELGGQMDAYNGWERANWFATPDDDTSIEASLTFDRRGPWEPRVREECESVRDGVGVLDLPGFARYTLRGKGAAAWLESRIVGALPRIGRMNLAYFSDSRGRVVTEMSVMRHADDSFVLITASVAQWHDYELLVSTLAANSGISIEDRSTECSTLIITGPESRNLLSRISHADFELPWLSHQRAVVAGQQVTLARVSYAGELGWEVHAANSALPPVYDAVLSHGAKPFGMWALNSLRLEKAYRVWKGDLSTDYTLLQSGLRRFIKFDKSTNFPGKAALQSELQAGSERSFVALEVDLTEFDTPYMSTIWKGNQVVGETTTGAWGYRLNKSMALGIVRTEWASAGECLEIEIFGQRCQARVMANSELYDPMNERLKA
ncbi:MAG: FAD-dependent oxidoreductase [Rhodobacteraceae bacterium]|nr:FAD-dependent oxidoreductase [Paracoccaceae bacterium]